MTTPAIKKQCCADVKSKYVSDAPERCSKAAQSGTNFCGGHAFSVIGKVAAAVGNIQDVRALVQPQITMIKQEFHLHQTINITNNFIIFKRKKSNVANIVIVTDVDKICDRFIAKSLPTSRDYIDERFKKILSASDEKREKHRNEVRRRMLAIMPLVIL
jgi:hypothetical protein